MPRNVQKLCHDYIESKPNPWKILHDNSVSRFEARFINDSFNGTRRILDSCGGNGLYSSHLSKKMEVTVIDCAQKLLQDGKCKYPESKFVEGSVFEMPFEDGYFDGALLRAHLMYFSTSERVKYFKELYRVLKPGSNVCIIDRNSRDYMFSYLPCHITMDPFEKKEDFINYESILTLLNETGFTLKKSKGYFFSVPNLFKWLFFWKMKDQRSYYIPVNINLLAWIFPKRSRWLLFLAERNNDD